MSTFAYYLLLCKIKKNTKMVVLAYMLCIQNLLMWCTLIIFFLFNVGESALPSSANWGTKSDKSRKDKSFHGQKHVDQWPQPHPLRSSDRNHHTRNHLLCNSEESLKIAGSGNVSELLKQPIATSDSSRRHSSSVVSISSDASEHDYENVESVASEDSESVKTDGLDEMTKDTGWNDNSTVNGKRLLL
jgi:hypothetical protein